jgi:hypothetical protein
MTFSLINAAGPDCGESGKNHNHAINIGRCSDGYSYGRNDDVRLKIDGGDVIITCDKRRHKFDEVRITDDYRLEINGQRIEMNDEQKALLKDFHGLAMELDREAKAVGKEGAKIGLEGARIGAKAASGVLRLLFLDFNEDEFEAKIEREAEELERMADKLEERAEKLEEMADNLEDMQDDLSRKIPELDELGWF